MNNHDIAMPELRKEIRLKAARLVAAMDAELEAEAAAFSRWWLTKESDHCKEESTLQSNPSLR